MIQYDPWGDLRAVGYTAVRAVAEDIMTHGERDMIFGLRATNALVALVYGAVAEGVPTWVYIRGAMTAPVECVWRHIMALPHKHRSEEAEIAATHMAAFSAVEPSDRDRFLSSSWETLRTKISPIVMDDRILAAVAAPIDAGFSAKELLVDDCGGILFLVWPESALADEGGRGPLGLLLRLVQAGLVRRLLHEADAAGGRLPVPVLFIADEGGRLPVPGLAGGFATWAGRRLYPMVLVQDIEQLEGAYGSTGAATIWPMPSAFSTGATKI